MIDCLSSDSVVVPVVASSSIYLAKLLLYILNYNVPYGFAVHMGSRSTFAKTPPNLLPYSNVATTTLFRAL